jgi:dTDP-4-dehydrorhamnose 3,5-epimerase
MRMERMGMERTPIQGCLVLTPEPVEDERGFFARVWDRDWGGDGFVAEIAQINLSGSVRAGTIRGLHWQVAPHEEAKVVRCVSGAVFDVCVDVRNGSSSFGQWYAVELSAVNRRALYVPPGCAHGYQTLLDGTEVLYSSSAPHHGPSERGVRWDDPGIGIPWPLTTDVSLSAKDRNWPDVQP